MSVILEALLIIWGEKDWQSLVYSKLTHTSQCLLGCDVILKMETRSSKMLFYCNTTWHHNSEDADLNLHCHENLKSHKLTDSPALLLTGWIQISTQGEIVLYATDIRNYPGCVCTWCSGCSAMYSKSKQSEGPMQMSYWEGTWIKCVLHFLFISH